MEEPVCGGDASACHCHTAWAGMLGAPLIRDEVLQGREPWEKRLLAPWRMLHPLHRQPLPLAGVMRWIASGAGCGPRRGGQARSPARVLLLPPAAAPGAMGRPRRGGDGGGTGASPLAPRNHPPALALARPGPQGVTLHASRLAQRSRERRALPRECMERRAEAGAPARVDRASADAGRCGPSPRSGPRCPAPPARAGRPRVATRPRTGARPRHSPPPERREARARGHGRWEAGPLVPSDRGWVWHRPGEKWAGAGPPGAARCPNVVALAPRRDASAPGAREDGAPRTAPTCGRHGELTGQHRPSPAASDESAKRSAAGRCTPPDPWCPGCARG
jgi:hypothetical protein